MTEPRLLPPVSSRARSAAGALAEGLNPEQREAVEYRGPALLIVAGAGSGKTRVLTHRIASLIASREAWPSQILAITFTNKAASEMRERIRALIGEDARGMWISTFHSACVRILRREAEHFGYPAGFTIYDSADSRALFKRIVKSLDADTLGITPASAQAKVSKLKNELVDADGYARRMNPADPRESMLLEIYRQYSRELVRNRALDFDDLIGETVYLFRAHPEVAALYQRRFRHVLVDEYQDTNHAQYALIRELTRRVDPETVPADTRIELDPDGSIPPASITVVGDSDQSIYAFRGADIRNITEFEQDFPGAKVVLLEQNYRSTQSILDTANAVIAHNFDRTPKRLWTAAGAGPRVTGYIGYSAHDEAQFVADEIARLHDSGTDYSDIAVFYRTNAQTRALEEIFVRSAVPYRLIGGTKFYERAEIKDVLAYLVTIVNPADETAVRRILNSPKRGIGQVTETRIANFAAAHGETFRQAMRHADDLGVGPKLRHAITDLATLLDESAEMTDPDRPAGPATVADIVKHVVKTTGYVDALRATGNPQDDARAENVEEFVSVAKEFAKRNAGGTLVEFLTEVSLVAASDDLDDASGSVSLMTLHTAKGLEFDAVFITGVEEELLPHRMSIDTPDGIAEERRLFYVGITRARKRLTLSLARSRTQFGEFAGAMPSRFLDEIPAELIEWHEAPGSGFGGGAVPGEGVPGESGERTLGTGVDGRARGPAVQGGRVHLDGPDRPARPERGARGERDAGASKHRWTNAVTGAVRDNSGLELAAGDRIRHADFGDGTVRAVLGSEAKRIAEVDFDSGSRKKLLIRVAPIEKLEP